MSRKKEREELLDLLLSGLTPKNIAIKLNIPIRRLWERSVVIYRQHEVNNRYELMAKFIKLDNSLPKGYNNDTI